MRNGNSLVWDRKMRYRLGLLAVLALVALYEIIVWGPTVLQRWVAWDYSVYVEMGRAVLDGVSPYGPWRYYPLPTILWLFVPLALLPDSFRLVWVMMPVVFLLMLHGWRGLLFLLFPPLWWVMTDGMFDAWLILPFAWLLANRPRWAGSGAALLLLKPHVTALPVFFMLGYWFIHRDKQNLIAFGGVFLRMWFPSFALNPRWPLEMLAAWNLRLAQFELLPLLTSSVWSWWAVSGFPKLSPLE